MRKGNSAIEGKAALFTEVKLFLARVANFNGFVRLTVCRQNIKAV